MSRLEKKAWFELGLTVMLALISGMFIKSMIANNAQGMIYVAVLVFVGCILMPVIVVCSRKEEEKYDERENTIRLRAFYWSACALSIFLIFACYLPFFLIGGAGSIEVYYLLIVFWGSLLIAQAVYSSIILFQCAKDTL